jgi:hypothetical protein
MHTAERVESRELRIESQKLTREQMIEVLWRGFGHDGNTPESFREYLDSRSTEQLAQMVEMLNASTPGELPKVEPDFQDHVAAELAKGREKHGPITGCHDGYGKILEEVDELWDEVRRKESQRSKGAMYSELVQIAALCQRMAEDLNLLEREAA